MVRPLETGQKPESPGEKKVQDSELNPQIDRIVKSNLELIVLSALAERPMCGYDVIRSIFLRSNVFLSQGTVYPLLYTLRDKGILRAEFGKGNMRTKVYYLTPEGEQIYREKLNEFVKAVELVSSLVGSGTQCLEIL